MKTRLLRRVRRKVGLYRPSPDMYVVRCGEMIYRFRKSEKSDFEKDAFEAYRYHVRIEAYLMYGSKRYLKRKLKRNTKNRIR